MSDGLPRAPAGGLALRLMMAASLTLVTTSCAELSPQVADQRPTFGFTPRAASSPQGNGFYDELCRRGLDRDQRGVDCPQFYGLLPAALDEADAARLSLLKAELNESGAPWLATAMALPVGAYALYRGIFGHGDPARQEVARLGLAGGAVYGWLSARESRPRQSARQAGIEALSCAMYGASARYLYERRYIVGGSAPSAPDPLDPDPDGSVSLARAQAEVRVHAKSLRLALYSLRQAIASQPATVRRVGSFNNACDHGGTTTACQLSGQGKAPVVVEDNPEVRAASSEVTDAEALLKNAAARLSAARALHDRIDNAPFELLHAVKRVEEASNKAVLATEADVATLRSAVGNLKLGNQSLSGLISQSTSTSATDSKSGGNIKAQDSIEFRNAGGRGSGGSVESPLWHQRIAVRNASLRLQSSMDDIQVHLDTDEARAKLVRGLGHCEFVPPGLKLVVDPDGPVEVAAGTSVRFSAQGGSSLPTVTMTGNTDLKARVVLLTEPDTTAGRQTLGVTVSPPADTADQNLRLVFRNEDLVTVRDVAVRKPGAKK